MCACAGAHIWVQKCFFRAARAHADIVWKICTQTLGRSASKCMYSEMSTFAQKRQESRLTLGTRSSAISKGSTPLYQVVDAIAAVPQMLYFAQARWPDWRKSIGTVNNLFIAVVCCSLIQQFVEMCTILKEIPLKWRFQQFFKTTPASDMRHFLANGSTLMTGLQMLSLQQYGYFSAKLGMNFSNS